MTSAFPASACIIAALLVAASGCSRRLGPPALLPVQPLVDVPPFTRVLVAGFVSTPVAGVDANEETSRLLRRELRSEVSLDVLNMDPLRLDPPMLDKVAFWRRLGEEYREPLIVTGVVDFKSAGRHYQERSIGRRRIRLWLPQYSLAVRLLLIDGKTGQPIGSAVCAPGVARAATGHEPALSLFYRLIDRAMPSMLGMFGRRALVRSNSGTACRIERDEQAAAS